MYRRLYLNALANPLQAQLGFQRVGEWTDQE
jgi:hypothetical protein